jgi:aspartyl-tRNA(Asn)/glutamyl-tRNA(Gln) amidotransferase subunit A
MADAIVYTDVVEISARIRDRDISPVEVLQAHLERIESINPKINAVIAINERALNRAREAEVAAMNDECWGPLHGVPFTAKEVFDTKGVRSTRGSMVFADHVPETDATAVARLKRAGGILVGKTNCPEFALSAETANELFGRTSNPWATDHTSGGSSGGEAAAVAAGLSPLGIGTDLGGSNRLPSHYCGIVGFKPTQGRIPLTGSWPELMSRHMHVGPITRTVRDAALALSILSGPDGKDTHALSLPAPDVSNLDHSPAKMKLRVGWFTEGPFAPVSGEIQEVVKQAAEGLSSLGCILKPVSFEWEDKLPISVAMAQLIAEADRYFRPFIAGHEANLSESIRGLLESPMPTLAEYLQAMERRETLAEDVTRFFTRFDLLLCPTSPTTAPKHSSEQLSINETMVAASHAANVTATFGLTGHPAISVPFGMSRDGLPIGVQMVTDRLNEQLLLCAAYALESISPCRQLHPFT